MAMGTITAPVPGTELTASVPSTLAMAMETATALVRALVLAVAMVKAGVLEPVTKVAPVTVLASGLAMALEMAGETGLGRGRFRDSARVRHD